MGNTIGSEAARDPEGPGKDVAFFQAMNVRWLNVFITKIKDTKKSEFSLANSNETLKWSDYFRIFIDIKDSMGSESVTKERSNWHPASVGYAMTKRPQAADCSDHSGEYTPEKSGKVPSDDYTDDDPSEIGQEDFDGDEGDDQSAEWRPDSPDSPSSRKQSNQRPVSAKSRDAPKLPRNMDARYTNPMFFGYSTETVQDQEKVIAAERALLKSRENRAIERARATRSVAIDALERTTQGQANLRLDKIKKLEEKYETARAKREVELERNERELLDSAFAIYEVSGVTLVLHNLTCVEYERDACITVLAGCCKDFNCINTLNLFLLDNCATAQMGDGVAHGGVGLRVGSVEDAHRARGEEPGGQRVPEEQARGDGELQGRREAGDPRRREARGVCQD